MLRLDKKRRAIVQACILGLGVFSLDAESVNTSKKNPACVQAGITGDKGHSTNNCNVYNHNYIQNHIPKKQLDAWEKAGLHKNTIRMFLVFLDQSNIPEERWQEKLAEIAKQFLEQGKRIAEYEKQAQANKTTQGDERYLSLIRKAKALYANIQVPADFDRIDQLLAEAEAIDCEDAYLKLDRAAATRAQRGDTSMIKLDYIKAAEHYKKAAELVPDKILDHQSSYYNYIERYAKTLYQQGDEKGDNASLIDAIKSYQQILNGIDKTRFPNTWADNQNDLGNALMKLGERQSSPQKLEEAVTAYREALKEWTRVRVPLHWAKAQNNLGVVLWNLGERENNKKKLEKAVIAYREALTERTRDRQPIEWAETQNNLGVVLSSLGERESDTKKIEKAVIAYREALKEWTREKVPLNWAMTQNNLGTALGMQGKQENSPEKLEEAVTAFRNALKERTRERVPLAWAATQNNLGNTLRILGERENNLKKLEDAVFAYRATLKEWTRERVPLDWAMTQNNLGNALTSLGERDNSPQKLEEAVFAYREALKEFTHDRVPFNWAKAQSNLGYVLASLGKQKNDLQMLEAAIKAFETSWSIYKEGNFRQSDNSFDEQTSKIKAAIDKIKNNGNL